MLWGLKRENNKTKLQGILNDLANKGLKPSPPPKVMTRNLKEVGSTSDTVFQDNHGLKLAFKQWAKGVLNNAKKLHAELLNPQSKPAREARKQHNLHGSLRTAFLDLKKYKNEIGISIADKNLGPTVYKQDLYDDLTREYLTESGVYLRLGDCTEELKTSLLKKQRAALERASECIPERAKTRDVLWLHQRIKLVANTNSKLAGFYVIIKVHKMHADSANIPLQPIQRAIDTALEHVWQWLHSLICDAVHAHKNVTKKIKNKSTLLFPKKSSTETR